MTSSLERDQQVEPGPVPTAGDLLGAEERHRLLQTELSRVRAAALSWRNGLAGLLAGLLGFGLIRGRSDIGLLRPDWAVSVGVLLMLSLILGGLGVLALLRAGHGRPALAPVADIRHPLLADHAEAVASIRALQAGIVLVFCCVALLAGAVGATWYGPARSGPYVRVHTSGGTVCGSVAEAGDGRVVIRNGDVSRTVDLSDVDAVTAVPSCPSGDAG